MKETKIKKIEEKKDKKIIIIMIKKITLSVKLKMTN